MLIVQIPESGTRKEVYEVADKLENIGLLLADGIPEKEQMDKYLGEVIGLVTESTDFTKIHKGDRLKAISHAFSIAAAQVYDQSIVYEDEIEPVVPEEPAG